MAGDLNYEIGRNGNRKFKSRFELETCVSIPLAKKYGKSMSTFRAGVGSN